MRAAFLCIIAESRGGVVNARTALSGIPVLETRLECTASFNCQYQHIHNFTAIY